MSLRPAASLAALLCALGAGCTGPLPAEHPDGGITDAGHDAGSDGGSPDGGSPDGGQPDGGFDPRTWRPPSKGLWIWYFAYTGMTAAQAAQRAHEIGVSHALIKSGQDANFWSTRYTAAALAEFTSRGIHVFAWPYVTPNDIAGSIDAAAQAARVPGTDGLVLDVEAEFEGAHAAAALQLCDGIRAKVPGVFLGYTSFGWVGYHGSFPFDTFDRHCGDAFFPQVYWSDRGVTWTHGYDQAVQMIQAAGLKAPVWIIQSNDDTPARASPSTADLNSFFDKAGVYSSLWEFPSSGAPGKLPQLPLLHWRNP